MSKPIGKLFASNPDRWNYATWIDVHNNYLYIETPKVCCTTIKQILQKNSSFKLPKNEQAIHYRNPPHEYIDSVKNYVDYIDKMIENGLFVFAFVRNPFDRLVSAYIDKIVRSQGKFWSNYRSAIVKLNKLESASEINFEHFVNYVDETPNNKRDIHWRSQFSLLAPDIINYSFIGKFEDFDKDMSQVLQKLSIRNVSPGSPVNSSRNVRLSEEKHLFLREQSRIEKIYRCDYDAFGYT